MEESEVWEAGRLAFREGKRKAPPKKLPKELATVWREGWQYEKTNREQGGSATEVVD